MPSIPAARREQSPAPPAARNGWRCPTCGATGRAQNAQAAQIAGTRHFLDHHDDSPRQEPHA